jgi:branched-chain amino acid transport system permease protein
VKALLWRTARGTALFVAPLALIAVLGDALASPADLRVIVNFIVALVLVLAIQSFSGNSGIVSFGHVGFMGVGAYAAALLTIPPDTKRSILPDLPGFLLDADVGFVPAVFISAAVGAAVAAVLGLALTRMQEGAMAMATIGVLVIFFVVFDNWDEVTRGATGIFDIPQSTTVYAALGFAALALAVSRAFRESNAGLKLRASRTDALAAAALGANVVRLRFYAWTLSGALMAMGGGLWAQFNLAFGPKQFFFAQTFNLLAMLVVGGLASTSGAVVGAFTITAVFEIMRRAEESIDVPGITHIVVAAIILLVLYFRREGLMGLSELDDVISRRIGRKQTGSAKEPEGRI